MPGWLCGTALPNATKYCCQTDRTELPGAPYCMGLGVISGYANWISSEQWKRWSPYKKASSYSRPISRRSRSQARWPRSTSASGSRRK